ncbi:hypothetical protein [Antrihabitans stalactiti]|uniref:Uncharacterized protein n=1 Tax=Antrihabitans stalactiti TaxID=2584121 RepID=A0A848KG21_9NOCA|nr:hypothetical protein [Antrihabitans stalactiti]NMN96618.1 hypothetical protein [Antrihabitans stalactiti]
MTPDQIQGMASFAEGMVKRVAPFVQQIVEEHPNSAECGGRGSCPLCAYAAIARGEQSELLNFLAKESAMVTALFSAAVDAAKRT